MKYLLAAALVILIAAFALTNLSPVGKSMNGLAVAKASSSFVRNAYNENTGYFELKYSCFFDTKACAPSTDLNEPPHSGYAMMSLKEVGRHTSDTELQALADSILDKAIERCASDARYCEWNFFPLHAFYTETKDKKYLDAMLSVVDTVMRERPVKEVVDANIPVKWWRLYESTGEKKYLDRVVKIADEELASKSLHALGPILYTSNGQDIAVYDVPSIWALFMPAYFASDEERFLDHSIATLEAAALEKHLDAYNTLPLTSNYVKGIEATLWVAEADASRKDAYRAKAVAALQQLLEERWDTPKRPLFNGDYGFLVATTTKATNVQGWITFLLTKLADEQFSEPAARE